MAENKWMRADGKTAMGYDMRAEVAKIADGDAPTANGLMWALSRWFDEVSLRPLVNVHRRTLDDTWRQVIRYFGGEAALKLIAAPHDELVSTYAKCEKAAPHPSDPAGEPVREQEPVAWIREKDLVKLKELGANADVALLGYKAIDYTTALFTRPVEAERDALRYRWLRHLDNCNKAWLFIGDGCAGSNLDREIDAAMAQGVKNGD
jgi:hypothetical protein